MFEYMLQTTSMASYLVYGDLGSLHTHIALKGPEEDEIKLIRFWPDQILEKESSKFNTNSVQYLWAHTQILLLALVCSA